MWRVYPVLLFLLFCLPGVIFAQDETFILGPGDTMEISVWKDETLTKTVMVLPDGTISFPLIGDVQADGKTVAQLRKAVQEKIKEFVPDSPVSIHLVKIESTNIYVVGKVARPGVFSMVKPVTVMQALAMAGGLNSFADKDGIIVIRKNGKKQNLIPFDYDDMVKGKNLDVNVTLLPGDTVVVP